MYIVQQSLGVSDEGGEDAIAGAMLTHQSLATRLLSHEGEGTRELFLSVVYEMLKKDLGGDLLTAVRGA